MKIAEFHTLVLDSLEDQIAVIDREGEILYVNRAWERFGAENGVSLDTDWVGVNYLAVCDESIKTGDNLVLEAVVGIRDVIAGKRADYIYEYPCHSSNERRWFMMRVLPVTGTQNYFLLYHHNITQRKLKDEKIIDSENRLKCALEGSGFGLWDVNIQTGESFYSKQWKEMLGFTEEEISPTYNEWVTRIHPDDQKQVLVAMKEYLDNNSEVYAVEYRMKCKDNTFKWILSRGKTIGHSDDGLPLRIIGTHTDISERKVAEEKLKEREAQLFDIYENAPVGIFHSVKEGRLIKANPALANILGYSNPEEFISAVENMATQLYMEPCIRMQILDEMITSDGWIHHNEVLWRRKDNSIVAVDMTGRKVLNATGQIAYFEGFIVDITERKASQEALVQSEELYRILFRDSPDAYLIISDGVFIDCNRATEVMLNCERTQIIGQPPDILSPEFQPDGRKSSESASEKINDALQSGSKTFEWVHKRIDGSEFYVDVSIAPMILAGKPALLTTWRDITERKHAQINLEESCRKLETLSITDGLTGVANRRRFDEVLAREYARHVRSKNQLSLILLDIDFFKLFNDEYGHVCGDECLRQISQVIASCTTRSADLVARYGGEEFACILPETDCSGAVAVAEEIRKSIEKLKIPHSGSSVASFVTASFGVVTVECSSDRSVKDVVIKADELLYRAKSLGRNRVEFNKPNLTKIIDSRNLITLEWKDEFLSGNKTIDGQHQLLFRGANELLEAVFSGLSHDIISSIVSQIIDNITRHIRDEEQILQAIQYNGLDIIVEEHAKLLDRGNKIIKDFNDKSVEFGEVLRFLVNDMIKEHMLVTDRAFFPQINTTDGISSIDI